MRQLVVPSVRIKRATLQGAFEAVFGPGMLRRVHGQHVRVGPFLNDARTFTFEVEVSGVPRILRRFFCGERLVVTTRQDRSILADTKWQVTNRLKLHFVGAELFAMRPVFWLETRDDDDGGTGVYLGGTVDHSARLPPPLNRIAEAVMMRHSERELRHFGACLAEAGVV